MGRLRVLVGVVACLVVASLAPGAAAGAPAPPVLDDAAKQERMLTVLERFVPFAESFWRASDLAEPRTGYFKADGPGVTQPRGVGNVAIAYATLLTARPAQPAFAGIPRATLEDHLVQAIRHEALTHKASGAGYARWGGGTWQSALETYGWGFAAKLIWDDLDEETRELVERVVTAEADILITKPPAKGVVGDTGAEDNGWNAPVAALATTMFPEHPRVAAWREAARRHAINASTRELDRDADTPVLDGRPLREWFAGAVVHPDLTMENHGFFNPIYQQVTHANLTEGAVMLAHAGEPVPDAFSFRTEKIWDDVLGPVVSEDGDLILTAGQDWTSKDYQHLLYLSALATRFKRADASLAESRALELVARRQATHANGSIVGQPLLGYESVLVKRLTMAWWNHRLFGPSPVPTAEQLAADREKTGGVREYPYISTVQGPLRDAFVSMSWDDTRAMGLIVPSAAGHEDDPILTAYAPRSLLGSATGVPGPWTCACEDDRFSTAGTIGDRRFSMTAFPDGVTMLLDRGTGSTFNLAFERIPGLTGERPVYHEGGEGLGALPGTWANVADRIGLVVAGGGGLAASDVGGANPYRRLDGSASTGTGNRGALVLPTSDRGQTQALAASVVQPDPGSGWSALYGRAPDDTGRFAVARWDGDAERALELHDDRGAPLTLGGTTIDGDRATTVQRLDAPASRGEVVRFFAQADGPLSARALGDDRAQLVNDGETSVRVVLTHVGAGATTTAERVIAPGESVEVRLAGGELITAGPEYEHVLAARDRIAALRDQVLAWEQDGTLSSWQARTLAVQAEAIVRTLDRALADITATTPDTAGASAAVDAAALQLALLVRGSSVPDVVRTRLAEDRAAALSSLEQARETGLSVVVRLAPTGSALPGEALPLRVVVLNRGRAAAVGGRLVVSGPEGWGEAVAQVPTLAPGAAHTVDLALDVPAHATPGEEADLSAALRFRQGLWTRTATAWATVTVRPALELIAAAPVVPLAAGGFNAVTLRAVSHAARDLPLTVTTSAAEGITATGPSQALTVPAGGEVDVPIEVRNASVATGETELVVTAVSGAVRAQAVVALRHGVNLALNGLGAPWPAVSASSEQAAYPPALATDGAAATFWVSAGSSTQTGPSPSNPISLGVDFGAPVDVGRVVMTPRANYGPKTYAVQASDDGQTWRDVASVPNAAISGATTTAFPATRARHLRIRITAGHDRGGAARNVQVAELDVRRE